MQSDCATTVPAIQLDPNFAFAHSNRVFALVHLVDHHQAIEVATKALLINAANPAAFETRSERSRQFGRDQRPVRQITSCPTAGLTNFSGVCVELFEKRPISEPGSFQWLSSPRLRHP